VACPYTHSWEVSGGDITIQIPANAVRLEAQHLVIPAYLGRYMISELLRAVETEETPDDDTTPTHLVYNPVLGFVN